MAYNAGVDAGFKKPRRWPWVLAIAIALLGVLFAAARPQAPDDLAFLDRYRPQRIVVAPGLYEAYFFPRASKLGIPEAARAGLTKQGWVVSSAGANAMTLTRGADSIEITWGTAGFHSVGTPGKAPTTVSYNVDDVVVWASWTPGWFMQQVIQIKMALHLM